MKARLWTSEDLPNILHQMADYVKNNEPNMVDEYFEELSKCGLFHDAIGKVEKIEETDSGLEITVLEEY